MIRLFTPNANANSICLLEIDGLRPNLTGRYELSIKIEIAFSNTRAIVNQYLIITFNLRPEIRIVIQKTNV